MNIPLEPYCVSLKLDRLHILMIKNNHTDSRILWSLGLKWGAMHDIKIVEIWVLFLTELIRENQPLTKEQKLYIAQLMESANILWDQFNV